MYLQVGVQVVPAPLQVKLCLWHLGLPGGDVHRVWAQHASVGQASDCHGLRSPPPLLRPLLWCGLQRLCRSLCRHNGSSYRGVCILCYITIFCDLGPTTRKLYDFYIILRIKKAVLSTYQLNHMTNLLDRAV